MRRGILGDTLVPALFLTGSIGTKIRRYIDVLRSDRYSMFSSFAVQRKEPGGRENGILIRIL